MIAHNPMRSAIASVALVAALAYAAAADAQGALVSTPALPAFGQEVSVELSDPSWPTYLPATRYTRNGFVIDIEFEYVTSSFGPVYPSTGFAPLVLGELAPGTYEVRAHLRDLGEPSVAPIDLALLIDVSPPPGWGIYTVPQAPMAFSATEAVVYSAAHFDPATLRSSVAGNVVRVDFDYHAGVYGEAPPAHLSAYGAVRIPELAPGTYRLEGWGRADPAEPYEMFFTRTFAVSSAVPVVEFYSALLDHYFVAAGADEIDLLDRGGQGDWKRTGQRFSAWLRQSDAPAGASPVCRFYAFGPNSHFYTGSAQECAELRTLEAQQRAEASARGEPFLGWGYEATAFWAAMPVAGACPAGLSPVFRAYNDRALQMDSNHRFMADAAQRSSMSFGWLDEGAHLCSAG